LFRPPFQRWLSTSSGAVQGRAALGSDFSFVSFSLGLHRQRKAAKESCYLKIVCLCNAFSFEEKGPKEKAWQKENAVLQGCSPRTLATARGEPLLKKWTKRFAWCGANTPINPNLSVTHEKTPPYSNIVE